MNLTQLLSLIEQGQAEALHFSLDSESRIFKLTLHCKAQDADHDGLVISLDSLRESDEFGSEISRYAAAVSGQEDGRIAVDLQLLPIVDYMAAAGATDMMVRRDGDSVIVVRLSKEMDGQAVAYYFALTTDSLHGTDEASHSDHDRALYDLSVAFRKSIVEAQQKSLNISLGFERELVLPNGPLLCLGGPRDGERVPDAGPFLRLPSLNQIYEKRWFRSAGLDRSFYVHSGTSDATAATLARAVMTGTTR